MASEQSKEERKEYRRLVTYYRGRKRQHVYNEYFDIELYEKILKEFPVIRKRILKNSKRKREAQRCWKKNNKDKLKIYRRRGKCIMCMTPITTKSTYCQPCYTKTRRRQ